MNICTKTDLINKQKLNLDQKILISQTKIIEYYQRLDGKVYISFSGGKDSVVLLDVVRKIYPNVKGVFVDTGLEFPEIKEFVKTIDNIETIYPTDRNGKRRTFKDIICQFGYPFPNKEQAGYIYEYRTTKSDKLREKKKFEPKKNFCIANKNMYLTKTDFICSNKCCVAMKKNPFHKYEKRTGLSPIIGSLAEESLLRSTQWFKNGCNSYSDNKNISNPLSIWTTQDILLYIRKYNLNYCKEIYGDINENDDGMLYLTKRDRTGCVFCCFGIEQDKVNRFKELKKSHPKLYDYCIYGGEICEDGIFRPNKNGLGIGHILDQCGVEY